MLFFFLAFLYTFGFVKLVIIVIIMYVCIYVFLIVSNFNLLLSIKYFVLLGFFCFRKCYLNFYFCVFFFFVQVNELIIICLFKNTNVYMCDFIFGIVWMFGFFFCQLLLGTMKKKKQKTNKNK